jgi:hypothetical protein
VELLKRHAEALADETLDSAPITVISGARQGKSTPVGQLASRHSAVRRKSRRAIRRSSLGTAHRHALAGVIRHAGMRTARD